MFRIDVGKVVEALKPYGATPIVAVIVGLGAFAALVAHADPTAVGLIALLVLGVHIYGQERNATLRERELRVEFDHALRVRAAQVTGKLEDRLAKRKKPSVQSLDGDEQ